MAWSDAATMAQQAARTALGDSVTYTPDGGSGESITAPFFSAFESVTLQGDVPVISEGPACAVYIADLTQTPVAGDTITANSVVYTIEEVRLDGEGAALLMLSR